PTPAQFDEIDRLAGRISAEYFDLNDSYSLGIIRSELHILLTKLFRIKAGQNRRISDRKYLQEFVALQRLIEQYAFERKKVMDYAKMMGLSTKTLNTITQSIIHMSAKAFIDEVSTKHIKRLLINTKDSVKEIAFASGFEETTNFYKYFKRQTGITPEQFRNSGNRQ
ncbi:MAG: helix-turn-helix domain-containing protein, partial [Bacteroidota bacterium]